MNKEQLKQVLATVIPKLMESEMGFIKHEREELVEKLSNSNYPELRSIGLREIETIRLKKMYSKVTVH